MNRCYENPVVKKTVRYDIDDTGVLKSVNIHRCLEDVTQNSHPVTVDKRITHGKR